MMTTKALVFMPNAVTNDGDIIKKAVITHIKVPVYTNSDKRKHIGSAILSEDINGNIYAEIQIDVKETGITVPVYPCIGGWRENDVIISIDILSIGTRSNTDSRIKPFDI